MAVIPKVRSALCAASQLPGEEPTDVEDAPTPACLSKPDDDDDDDEYQQCIKQFGSRSGPTFHRA